MADQNLYIALEGARTLKGGVVRINDTDRPGSPGAYVALVGDEVVYPDGRVATITSGAGFGMASNGRPTALVGSHVSRDDRIICSPDNGLRLEIGDTGWVEGLFDPSYVHPAEDASHD